MSVKDDHYQVYIIFVFRKSGRIGLRRKSEVKPPFCRGLLVVALSNCLLGGVVFSLVGRNPLARACKTFLAYFNGSLLGGL
jgi:hypothetical protein